MGFLSAFKTIAETKELHSDAALRSRYYKSNYQKVKAVILQFANEEHIDIRNIDDAHRELYLQGSRFHIIVSLVQVNPIETSVDFKVEYYGLIGFNRPRNMILKCYDYLNTNLSFKGVGLHP